MAWAWTVAPAMACLLAGGGAYAQGVATSDRPFSLTPRLGIQELFTDNVLLSSVNRESDFVTQFSAGLDANLNSERTRGMLNLNAAYDLYGKQSDLNGWSFNGYGTGALDISPGVLTIEAQGQLQTGSISTFGEPATERSTPRDRLQVGTYAIGPHLTTTVGSYADLEASVRLNQVSYTAADASTVATNIPEDSTYVDVGASLDTKERFSNYQLLAVGQYVQDDNDFRLYNGIGSGFWSVGHNVRLIGRAGYEDIYQPLVVNISAPIWSLGVEYRLNERSVVSVEGGERYDRPTWKADAFVQVSDRFFMTGRYREEVRPSQITLGDSFRSFGSTTQQLPTSTPGAFNIQGNLNDETSLDKVAELRFVYIWPRQTIDFSVAWNDQYLLTTRAHDRTVVSNVRYTQKLRPDLTGEIRARYDRTLDSPVFGKNRSYGGSARLIYALRETTNISAGYAYTNGKELFTGGEKVYENVVFVSLSKSF